MSVCVRVCPWLILFKHVCECLCGSVVDNALPPEENGVPVSSGFHQLEFKEHQNSYSARCMPNLDNGTAQGCAVGGLNDKLFK